MDWITPKDIFLLCVTVHQQWSSSRHLLNVPSLRVACLVLTRVWAFLIMVLALWNTFLEEVRGSPFLENFRRPCKYCLFTRAFAGYMGKGRFGSLLLVNYFEPQGRKDIHILISNLNSSSQNAVLDDQSYFQTSSPFLTLTQKMFVGQPEKEKSSQCFQAT